MTKRPWSLAGLLASGAALAGCAQTTAYVRPATTLPAAFAQAPAAASNQAAASGDWWKRFGDTGLDALVDQALARNNSLAQTAISVERARVKVGLSVINPTVSGQLTASGSGLVNGKSKWNGTYGGDAS